MEASAGTHFNKIISRHNALIDDKQGSSLCFDGEGKAYPRAALVCKRPKPEDNLILLGAGDGLEKLTSEEFKFVRPFFDVARAWLREEPYLLHSKRAVVQFLENQLLPHVKDLAIFICLVRFIMFPPKLRPPFRGVS